MFPVEAAVISRDWESTKTTVVKVLLRLEFFEDEMPMEVDINNEAAAMMLPSWSMISRMDQSTTIALLSYN
ncbi:2166_t:CDS:2 [Acaulospora morrowiae]|uniref:2166_t:CDS:1 n=1 Tax=Acaulospora morrowiae TaxID=94023 RepID=A0A9N9ETT8_9GLOM|nr:2166_t:CDS:2 [Acaulospora morrowiae]